MKRLSPKFKAQFIGLSKREAIALLEASRGEYNIYAIDYFANGREMPKAIYVNYGCMGLFFDRHSRRITKVD